MQCCTEASQTLSTCRQVQVDCDAPHLWAQKCCAPTLGLQAAGGRQLGMPRWSAPQLPLPATALEAPAAPCVQAVAAGQCSCLARLHGLPSMSQGVAIIYTHSLQMCPHEHGGVPALSMQQQVL